MKMAFVSEPDAEPDTATDLDAAMDVDADVDQCTAVCGVDMDDLGVNVCVRRSFARCQ